MTSSQEIDCESALIGGLTKEEKNGLNGKVACGINEEAFGRVKRQAPATPRADSAPLKLYNSGAQQKKLPRMKLKPGLRVLTHK